MNQAAKAVANSLQFETKKDGLKQLQSGEWTLSLKVHANDVPAPLLTAAMGTRYMAVLVEIGDDETPVEQSKTEDKHRLSRQAAMLCGDERFHMFLKECFPARWMNAKGEGPEHVANCVRSMCSVQSRSQFDRDEIAAARWRDLKGTFEAWKITA